VTDHDVQGNIPEAVGVFDDVDALYAAIDELQSSGFDRALLSMVADEEVVREKLGSSFWRVDQLEDDPDIPRKPYFAEESYGAVEGMLVGLPLYVGAVATAGVLITPAGSLLTAVAASALVGGAGAAIGSFLAWRVGDRHAEYLQNQIRHGGLVLWVRTFDQERERRAVEILRRHSGRDVHVHGHRGFQETEKTS